MCQKDPSAAGASICQLNWVTRQDLCTPARLRSHKLLLSIFSHSSKSLSDLKRPASDFTAKGRPLHFLTISLPIPSSPGCALESP
uniref:Uncharacterized protein n=1 Tax=Salix viminalis TaxID=40686 RepID=A0A6N2LGS5_SALVM